MVGELVPARSAISPMRVSNRPRSYSTSAAALMICGLRRWSTLGRGLIVLGAGLASGGACSHPYTESPFRKLRNPSGGVKGWFVKDRFAGRRGRGAAVIHVAGLGAGL